MSNQIIKIPNIDNYISEVIDNVLILTPKNKVINEEEIFNFNYTKSIILECILKDKENIISNNKKYNSILIDIWSCMPTQKILQNTTYNFKLSNEKGLNGYIWNSKIGMSFQRKNSNGCLKEIINMVKFNNYKIEMKIKLENEKIIYFKI